MSPCTPAARNANVGWKATASAPTVHAQRQLGSSSRRNMNTPSTVHAAIRAESTRIRASLVRISLDGDSQYGIASSA